jgi:hypothetical protein
MNFMLNYIPSKFPKISIDSTEIKFKFHPIFFPQWIFFIRDVKLFFSPQILKSSSPMNVYKNH